MGQVQILQSLQISTASLAFINVFRDGGGYSYL